MTDCKKNNLPVNSAMWLLNVIAKHEIEKS